MSSFIAVACGGALGASLRWAIYQWFVTRFPEHGYISTLTVNIVGSFVAGLLLVALVERAGVSDEYRVFLMTGLLGALTTFSTFSLDAVNLLFNGQAGLAVAYIAGSVLLCVAAAWLGMVVMRLI